MTVKDLIELLLKFPGDMEVIMPYDESHESFGCCETYSLGKYNFEEQEYIDESHPRYIKASGEFENVLCLYPND